MKIFCTGNTERKSIAFGLDQITDITSASISTGWDFTNKEIVKKFKEIICNYNVFVNSCYVNNTNQKTLLDIAYNTWMENNIQGHIFNIGTTLENTDDQSDYAISKRKLRMHSINLSDKTGYSGVKTTYLCLGGVNVGTVETETFCNPIDIAITIMWITKQNLRIPLVQLDGRKT